MSDLFYLAGKLGWHLLPIARGSKEPLLRNGWHGASNQPEQIEAWELEFPGCRWAVAFQPSGLVGFDLDVREGKDGISALKQRLGARDLPLSVGCITQSGGRRMIYQYAGWPTGKIDLRDGIEILWNGYGLIPPSEGYTWLVGAAPHEIECAPLPDWVPALLAPVHENYNKAPDPASILSLPIPEGARHDYLTRLAWKLAQVERNPDRILSTMWSVVRDPFHVAGDPAPDENRKLKDMVESALRKQPEPEIAVGESDWHHVTKADLTLPPRLGISTGLKPLDLLIGGLVAGEVLVIGARTSLGKSSLLCQWAIELEKAGKMVGFFSLEDSWPEIVRRMVKQGRDFDLDGMHIMDRAGLTIDQVIAAATIMRPDVVLVDYVQLVQSGQNRDNRVLQIGDVTRGLKILAKDLGVPVVAAAQLNRTSEDRGGEPRLSDFRESGSIEQDADIVLFITRTQTLPYQHTLHVGKNRHGPIGPVHLVFSPSTVTFGIRAFDD